ASPRRPARHRALAQRAAVRHLPRRHTARDGAPPAVHHRRAALRQRCRRPQGGRPRRDVSYRDPQLPLVVLDRISMAYGHLPLLDAASLQIDEKERVALVGRNGAGKSTLLQLVTGELPPDAGAIWRQPGLRVARLAQDVPLSTDRTVFDVVSDGAAHLDEEWQRD